jgi:tRNA pseudouridine38-40 synthase
MKMDKRTFKIIIAYDGTDFLGWQVQPKGITVFSCLTNSFKNAFGSIPTIIGPSRTDSGVHAFSYVAALRTSLKIGHEEIRKIWNFSLPETISIKSIELVDDNYSPRNGIKEKVYQYHIFTKRPLPFLARFGWHYRFIDNVDLDKLEKALKTFEGRHEFRDFCKVDAGEKVNTIREIHSMSLERIKRFGVLRITAKAPGFLRYQIRRMVGAALEVARKDYLAIEDLELGLKGELPTGKNLTFCAPGKGLCLRKILYK